MAPTEDCVHNPEDIFQTFITSCQKQAAGFSQFENVFHNMPHLYDINKPSSRA
jgi:hypothetical protein